MILSKYDSSRKYTPAEVLTLDALLYLAYEKRWKIKELTEVVFVPLSLAPHRFQFASIPEPSWVYSRHAEWPSAASNFNVESVDLEHIGFGGSWLLHWRVGWRPSTESLVVGLDRNDEYVHIEPRKRY